MVTLSIKNIPESLVKKLRQQAAANRRILSLEVLTYLERMTSNMPVDANAFLVNVRALRRTSKKIQAPDQSLSSLKGALKDMSTTNIREKRKRGKV